MVIIFIYVIIYIYNRLIIIIIIIVLVYWKYKILCIKILIKDLNRIDILPYIIIYWCNIYYLF